MSQDDINRIVPMIMAEIGRAKDDLRSRLRASLVLQIATIELLIEAKVTAKEEALQKIAQIQRELPDRFQDDDVDKALQTAIALLQNRADPESALFPG